VEKLAGTRRVLNRLSEPLRRDTPEPDDGLDEVERSALLEHADPDDEDMT